MKKIKIITDTASDISLETAEKYGIHLIPINLIIGGKTVKDKYEITNDEFYDYITQNDEIPKTAQITAAEHIDEFKKFIDEYSVIYVTISSKGSGTFQSANIAKNEILEENPDAEITIVDSYSYSYGYGYWVIEAAKMAQNGARENEIIEMLKDRFAQTDIILAVDTLEYLQKGGRISPAAKIIANVLDITPILSIEDGLVMSRDKIRGRKKILPKMVDMLMDKANSDPEQTIVIMQACAADRAEKMKELILEKTPFRNIVTAEIGPCVGIHTGPGLIALIYMKKM